ncbi:MAG: hypothetical protein IJK51_07690, partial [Bacteroidaceae bacterium]|nr:hypothetical protein [Bacteroidaceae bacterium]
VGEAPGISGYNTFFCLEGSTKNRPWYCLPGRIWEVVSMFCPRALPSVTSKYSLSGLTPLPFHEGEGQGG